MKSTSFNLSSFLKISAEKLLTYLDNSQQGKGKVLQQKPASELAHTMQLHHWIKNGGISPKEFSELMDYSFFERYFNKQLNF